MANVAFSDLSELTSLAAGDLLMVTDDSEAAAEKSKYIQMSTLRDYLLITGSFIRPQFVYKDADEIYIGAGWYDVAGKYAGWTSQLTESFSGLSANTRYYIYLDHSAITSGTAITATEIISSSTAPSYSHTYRGWYNGSDRCIFSILTDASGNVKEFYHDGDLVTYADRITELSGGTSSSFSDVDMASSVPAVCTRVLVSARTTSGNSQEAIIYWRTNGQTGSTGHFMGHHYRASGYPIYVNQQLDVITDSSQIFEYKIDYSAGSAISLYVYVDGWYFPVGM